MRVKRAPLNRFTLFPKLPVELQDIVWHHTLHAPRVLTMTHNRDEDEQFLIHYRQPTLASVCQASRRMVLDKRFESLPLWEYLLDVKSTYNFYNPETNIISLDVHPLGNWKDFSKFKILSVGIPYQHPRYRQRPFDAADAKAFSGLREIVILVGNRQAGCDVQPVYVPDFESVHDSESKYYLLWKMPGLRSYVSDLRTELGKTSNKWKAYQRRREKKGKSSPDWIMPTVRVAYMEEICETSSPYLYRHRHWDNPYLKDMF